jgi:hypothetical protein
MSSGKAAMKLRAQIKSKLSRARYFGNMLDAYQQVVCYRFKVSLLRS